jgi:hypothetical protein
VIQDELNKKVQTVEQRVLQRLEWLEAQFEIDALDH